MLTPQEAFRRNKAPREAKRRHKFNYVGVPAIFKLEIACKTIVEAFCGGEFGQTFVVGSALQRPDWRDVDIVCMLADADFKRLFPDVASIDYGTWEHDPRWLLMSITLSEWLSAQSGVLVDFKFQPMTYANKHHRGPRHPIGFRYAKPNQENNNG